ncbi:hypothetical protein PV08_01906 [Exophiala spinifera]|uniref:RING-type domain-containing protein n=1 Tax=Exophiala spinifera TaxID=91928 RepID=A0A0D1Z0Z5_9EURO|nr:uncharacterized protein PV08_01906 [Exophiala spinifera]KIW21326.1 hypothetical protein PV08_01906 [Exophiala spinifera]
MATTTTSPISSPTASPTGSPGSGGNGPSSPLLFFVALGFGVVFTNLWIIVGVKYCFRYNQRNRQRMNGEDPDGVDLGAMPRQHRRRREKKLMSMDEVNEKFPLIKYKTWRSNRADEGLPTAGGINNASRPASIHNQPRESKDAKESTELAPTHTISTIEEEKPQDQHGTAEVVGEKSRADTRPATPTRPKSAQSTAAESPIQKVTSNYEDEDDEQIQTAVPAEQLPDPGDACAICIDTIEDDDDIRGLHCGHAFHASCVDPWLTSRRACCPLCKADYYVPKPRPEGPNGEGLNRTGTNSEIQPPPGTFTLAHNGRGARRPAMVIPGRFMSIVYHDRDRHGFPVVVRAERRGPQDQNQQRDMDRDFQRSNPPQSTSWRSRIPGFRILGRGRAAAPTQIAPAHSDTQPTPSQLEAGR